MGAALHSETLAVLDLVATGNTHPWLARAATPSDEPAQPFTHDAFAAWVPQRFARTARIKVASALTMDTLPGMALIHRNGGSYTGVAIAAHETGLLAVYACDDGIWWARPWSLFADGRFKAAPPRLVAWRNPLEPLHAP